MLWRLEHGCHFLDTSQIINSSDIDGVHLEADEHSKLGHAVADQVREILPAWLDYPQEFSQ